MIRFTTDDIAMPALEERRVSRWIRAVAAHYGFGVGTSTISSAPTSASWK
ncbi:MAG: hypothetical protein IJ882_01395 [Paludibacteraceae bacterium]|nr:hypothetical protein [Paludibacteraceae bacterium]